MEKRLFFYTIGILAISFFFATSLREQVLVGEVVQGSPSRALIECKADTTIANKVLSQMGLVPGTDAILGFYAISQNAIGTLDYQHRYFVANTFEALFPKSYLYDVGQDQTLGTSDDVALKMADGYNFIPVGMETLSRKLYYMIYKGATATTPGQMDIKECTISDCLTTTNGIMTIMLDQNPWSSNGPVTAVYMEQKNRLYFKLRHTPLNQMVFTSCSLNPNVQDSCFLGSQALVSHANEQNFLESNSQPLPNRGFHYSGTKPPNTPVFSFFDARSDTIVPLASYISGQTVPLLDIVAAYQYNQDKSVDAITFDPIKSNTPQILQRVVNVGQYQQQLRIPVGTIVDDRTINKLVFAFGTAKSYTSPVEIYIREYNGKSRVFTDTSNIFYGTGFKNIYYISPKHLVISDGGPIAAINCPA